MTCMALLLVSACSPQVDRKTETEKEASKKAWGQGSYTRDKSASQ